MKRLIILALLLSVFLTGCVATYYADTYVPSDLRIDIDSDRTLTYGYAAVSDQKQIYHFGQEDSVPGIYSMDRDGNNVKLIVPERDVSQMQLVDKTLYYLSFDSVYYGDSSIGDGIGSKVYSLKSIDLNSGTIHDYDAYEAVFQDYFKEYHYNFERGLVGFYYCGNDQFLLSTVDLTVPTKRLELLSGIVTKDKMLPVGEVFYEHNIRANDMPFPSCNIYMNESLLMITDWDQIDYMEGLINSNNLYLVDGGTGASCESAGAEFDKMPYSKVSISEPEEKQVIYAIGNYVVLCELENNAVLKYLEIPDAKRINIVNNEYILAHNSDGASQTLYRFKSAEFIYEEIAEFSDEKIIAISNGFMLTMANDLLMKYKISNDDVEKIWSKRLGGDYLKSDFSIELCDEWLFIKKFDIDRNGADLVEKINVK